MDKMKFLATAALTLVLAACGEEANDTKSISASSTSATTSSAPAKNKSTFDTSNDTMLTFSTERLKTGMTSEQRTAFQADIDLVMSDTYEKWMETATGPTHIIPAHVRLEAMHGMTAQDIIEKAAELRAQQ